MAIHSKEVKVKHWNSTIKDYYNLKNVNLPTDKLECTLKLFHRDMTSSQVW